MSFAMGVLARHLRAPREAHWGAVVRLLCYATDKSTQALTWGSGEGMGGYVDASCQQRLQNRSATGSLQPAMHAHFMEEQ